MSLPELFKRVQQHEFVKVFGSVNHVNRTALEVRMPGVKVGSLCHVHGVDKKAAVEVVSLDRNGHVAMPLDDLSGIRLGDSIELVEENSNIGVGSNLLGQVIDSLGFSYDTGTKIPCSDMAPLYGIPQNPMRRELITEPLDLGVRSINACLTCGKGQRQGIFAGSGVGKSVLLGMMARHTEADVVVIGLIGERGREVREFIENELGEGRKKSVVVVETADKSPVRRSRGAYVATAVSEYFRKQGANVLLLMDSLTRFAMAQREIGIAAGEPPTTKGYPPSVYSSLSKLVERAGNWGEAGSITGLYTVLVEGDEMDDPVADNARAILDGHLILSRKLANRGHYPAIDIMSSVSRVMDQVVDKRQQFSARTIKRVLAKFEENEDAIQYGMYNKGTDSILDECIELEPRITKFLQQDRDVKSSLLDSKEAMESLLGEDEAKR